MAYILIIVVWARVWGGYSISIESIEFQSKEKCEAAISVLSAKTSPDGLHLKQSVMVCQQK